MLQSRADFDEIFSIFRFSFINIPYRPPFVNRKKTNSTLLHESNKSVSRFLSEFMALQGGREGIPGILRPKAQWACRSGQHSVRCKVFTFCVNGEKYAVLPAYESRL